MNCQKRQSRLFRLRTTNAFTMRFRSILMMPEIFGRLLFIVTNRRLFVVEKDSIKQEYDVSKCIDVKAEAKIGGGLLVINFDGVPKHIVHYSARHLSRYAYIARGIHILASGREEEVVSTEYEKICPKCHHAIPGTKYCPHCSKEGGFWKGFLKMAAPYKRKFAGIIVLMILAAVVTLLNPEIQKHLVDDVLKRREGGISTAFICLGIMFLLSVGIVVINILKTYYCTVLGATISKDLRQRMFSHIQILSLNFINDRRPGELMNRIVLIRERFVNLWSELSVICLRSVLFLPVTLFLWCYSM